MAGVSIAMLIGDNGILSQAIKSKTKTEIAQQKEKMEIILAGLLTKYDGDVSKVTVDELKSELIKEFGNENVTIEENSNGGFIIKINSNRYKIDSSLSLVIIAIIEPDNIDDWEYTINSDNTITINKYKGNNTEVIIPNYIGGLEVIEINGNLDSGYNGIWGDRILSSSDSSYSGYSSYGSNSNSSQKTITRVVISEGIKKIGDNAFLNSYNLQEIVIPDTVISIGSAAFKNCINLIEVEIPGNVDNISANTFYNCTSLVEVILNNGIKNIETCAFYKCENLEKIAISNTITNIGTYAFYRCIKLEKIVLPNTITIIDERAFKECECLEEIIIPSSVEKIGMIAFYGCTNLKNVYFISDSEIYFGYNCFYKSSGEITTFYFKSSDVLNSFTTDYYNSSYGVISTDFSW